MILRASLASILVVASIGVTAGQAWKNTAPEWFRANGQVSAAGGGVASSIEVHVQRYTSDADHDTLVAALKSGHDPFLAALRKMPEIGNVKIRSRTVPIRWARERPQDGGRRIIVVTDAPLFFAGAGAVDAKPTAGYDVAVVEMSIDSTGTGKGSMAPGARVKPGGPAGVELDDYSGQKITLVTVIRNPVDRPGGASR